LKLCIKQKDLVAMTPEQKDLVAMTPEQKESRIIYYR
jgi:hypothetical protein